jgi:adenylate kinase family enzyme
MWSNEAVTRVRTVCASSASGDRGGSADVALAFVLLLECGEDVMRERLLARGRTSGRADDNEEAIQKRLRVLRHETIPLVR